jgi:hypothetical protein
METSPVNTIGFASIGRDEEHAPGNAIKNQGTLGGRPESHTS